MHGEGPGCGLDSGGEPVSGRTIRGLTSRWIKEMESVFRTSTYPLRAKVWFTLDLLYQVARIDCAIYCAFRIADQFLRVVSSPV